MGQRKKDIITYTGNHVQKTKETIFKYYDEIQLPYYIPVEFSEDTEYDDVFVKELISNLDICIFKFELFNSKEISKEEAILYINQLDQNRKDNLSNKLNIYYDLQKVSKGRAKIIKFPMNIIKKD